MSEESTPVSNVEGFSLGSGMDELLRKASIEYETQGSAQKIFTPNELKTLVSAFLNSKQVKSRFAERVESLDLGEVQIQRDVAKLDVTAHGVRVNRFIKLNVVDFGLDITNSRTPGKLDVVAKSDNPIVENLVNRRLRGGDIDPQTGEPRPPVDLKEIVTGYVRERLKEDEAEISMSILGGAIIVAIENPHYLRSME